MTEPITTEFDSTESFATKTFGFWLALIAVLLTTTQLLRWFVLSQSWKIFLNDKFAFSLNIPAAISYILYLIVFSFIFRYLYLNWSSLTQTAKLSLVLVLTGGLSNLIERIWYGHVVDYIFVANGVLNLADLYILFGVVMLLATRRLYRV